MPAIARLSPASSGPYDVASRTEAVLERFLRPGPHFFTSFAQAREAPSLRTLELHSAVARGDERAVAGLIAEGVAVDARNERGETALLIAVQHAHTTIALALMRAGADINAQAANRDSPFLLAGARGRTAMLEAMLSKGPDYALRNRFGGTALIPACHYGHVETVRLLVARSKIDIDHINDLGWTCLLEAVILGDGGSAHQAIVQIVLAAGAQPNLADRDGVTPLAHARRRGQESVARLIEAAGGK